MAMPGGGSWVEAIVKLGGGQQWRRREGAGCGGGQDQLAVAGNSMGGARGDHAVAEKVVKSW